MDFCCIIALVAWMYYGSITKSYLLSSKRLESESQRKHGSLTFKSNLNHKQKFTSFDEIYFIPLQKNNHVFIICNDITKLHCVFTLQYLLCDLFVFDQDICLALFHPAVMRHTTLKISYYR